MTSWALVTLLAAAPAETWVVQPGDSCRSIARAALGSELAVGRLHELNPNLGPPPHRLQPGQVLSLKPRAEATVSYLRPDVQARTQAERQWAPATLGQGLFQLDEVSTLKRAGADLTFRDQSHLYLRENALVVIQGRGVSREAVMATPIELVSGATRLSLADLRGPAAFEIRSAGTEIAAHRAEVLVEVDVLKTNRVSVHKGQTTVAASGKKVSVSKGEGTRVFRGQAPEAPRRLLPSPALETPAFFFERVATVGWAAVTGAVRYRLEVASDTGFHNLTDELETTERQGTVEMPLGTSWVRVSAADEAGLWSIPSDAKRVDVVVISGIAEVGSAHVVFNGLASDVTVSLDGQEPSHPTGSIDVAAPGPHSLELVAPSGRAATTFDVRPPAGRFERKANRLTVMADTDDFTVTRDDDVADQPLPIEIAAGHEWQLRWHGLVLDAFREPPVAPQTEAVVEAMPTLVALRDHRVGRLKSATPWVSGSHLEAQLSAELGGEQPGALLAIRYERSLFDRLGLLAEVVGAVGPSTTLDATLGIRGSLVQWGLFRLGAQAMGSANLGRSSGVSNPKVRGVGLVSAGALAAQWAVAIDGGLDISNDAAPSGVFVGGRIGAHGWRQIAPLWELLVDIELGLKDSARDINLAVALSRKVGPTTLGVAVTYRVTTFDAGLAFIASW